MSSAEHSSEPAVPSLESLLHPDLCGHCKPVGMHFTQPQSADQGVHDEPITHAGCWSSRLRTLLPRFTRACARKPVSFEVFADDFEEMERQARIISAWAPNAIVKIPVTNTHGTSATPLVQKLIDNGVSVNVTAIFTEKQIDEVARALHGAKRAYISVFAGRIADTGRDPFPVCATCRRCATHHARRTGDLGEHARNLQYISS